MGCVNDKDLKSNLSSEPSIVAGSTMLRADQIVVLGDSVFLPTRNEDGEYQILEINNPSRVGLRTIDDKKINVHKGLANRAVRTGLS